MTESKTSNKRDQKIQGILDIAEQLFAEQGYDNVKMDAIAKAAGISKGSVFFYFKSKENLHMAITYRAFQALIDVYYQSLELSLGKSGLHRVMALLNAYLHFGDQHPYYFGLLLDYTNFIRSAAQQTLTPAMQESIYFRKVRDIHNLPLTIIVGEIIEGQKDGSILNQKDPNLLYLTAWAMIIGFSKLSIPSESNTFFNVPLKTVKQYLLDTVEKILLEPNQH